MKGISERSKIIVVISIMLVAVLVLSVLTNNILVDQNNPGPDSSCMVDKEPLNISLIDNNYTKIFRPIEYYQLSNGTIIKITDRNPFPFTIVISHVDSPGIKKLGVYKLVTYSDTRSVFAIASELGLDVNHIRFNEVTDTYIYNDDQVQLEYDPTRGFIRIIYKQPLVEYKSIIDDSLLRLYPDNIEFLHDIKPIKEVNGQPAEYAMVYTGYVEGVPSPIKIIAIFSRDNSSIREIQGLIVKNITKISDNDVIPPDDIPRLLSERVSGKITARDWYLSRLGFTSLTITDLELSYTVAPNGLLVPIYKLHGKWVLNYDNLVYSGELDGFIIAIYK
ncbi:MAG: hypothetical protein GXO43_06175 [Crenarchaeota archaeon]|nr:hypothetical protein [Thermoproteota archaeon]